MSGAEGGPGVQDLHLLLIDDEPADRELIARELRTLGPAVAITSVTQPEELERALEKDEYDLAITDYRLRWSTGLEVLKKIKAIDAQRPVIMFTASGSEEVAVEAMKAGLDDYLTKTAKHYPRIPYAVTACIERARQRRQLRRQAALIDLTQDALIVHDPAGRIRFWNQGGERLYGYPAAAVHGRMVHDLLHTRGLPPIEDVHALLDAQGVWSGELEQRRSDGRWITVLSQWRRSAEHRAGRAEILQTNTDISAIKESERALRLADQRKDEFLAMLAHELRNPMSAIRNAVELLARSKQGEAPARVALGVLQRQSLQLGRLVDDLLDVSRITRGRIQLSRRPVELTLIIAHAVETLEAVFREKKHSVSVTSETYRGLYVDADQARLTQSFVNVLGNAAKYTDPGGHICIHTREDGQTATVEISDSGIGIAPELVPKVFELFVQGEQSLDRSQGGLGVGLAVVRTIVAMHGGSVAVRSPGPGQGTTVSIQLPLIERPQRSAVAASQGSGPALRILLIDDNKDATDTLAMLLQLEGHEVSAAYGARSGLEAVRSFQPAVVLLDIGLPEMDGYEVARRLRASAEGRGVRLIALTGYGQSEDRARARAAGFDDHLTKPVAMDRLQRAIEGRSGRRREERFGEG